MAQHMDTHTEWESADHRVHRERQLSAGRAKQGRTGRRILTVLIAALVLAFIVWIPVEIWGGRQAEEIAPSSPTQSQITPSTAPNKTPETPAEVDAQHR